MAFERGNHWRRKRIAVHHAASLAVPSTQSAIASLAGPSRSAPATPARRVVDEQTTHTHHITHRIRLDWPTDRTVSTTEQSGLIARQTCWLTHSAAYTPSFSLSSKSHKKYQIAHNQHTKLNTHTHTQLSPPFHMLSTCFSFWSFIVRNASFHRHLRYSA